MKRATAVVAAGLLIASQCANGAAGPQSDARRVQVAAQQAPFELSSRSSPGAVTQGTPIQPLRVAWEECAGRPYSEEELRQMLAPRFTRHVGPRDVDLSRNYANPMDLLSQVGEARAYLYAQLKYANDPEMLKAYLSALNSATGRSALEYSPAEGQVRQVDGGTAVRPGEVPTAILDVAGLDAEVARRLAAQRAQQGAYGRNPGNAANCRPYR